MADFANVYCPTCGHLVMEILVGIARGRCKQCKKRVTAERDRLGDVRILTADRVPRKVA